VATAAHKVGQSGGRGVPVVSLSDKAFEIGMYVSVEKNGTVLMPPF